MKPPAVKIIRYVAVGLATVVLGACGSGEADDARPVVVVTTTVLGDVVGAIVEGDATVEVLMPPGADPHDFQLSSAQAARIRTADIVVVNGLGLEEGMADALASAEADGARVFEVAPLVDPIAFDGGDEHGEEGDEHATGDDPHFWMDPLRMARAAELISAEIAAAAGNGAGWEARGAAYAEELRELDSRLESTFAAIPPDRRKLVTNHNSLGYLADRYGFEVVGTVIPGSGLAEPGSQDLARLVETVRAEGVPAIFSETIASDALARAVAAELGRSVTVVELYTDSLGGPGSETPTYIDLMETNAARIVEALTGRPSASRGAGWTG